jgi:hypothetical protein
MKTIITAAIAALFATTAFAADVSPPVKAPPIYFTPGIPGWYVGLGAEADVAQSKISGNNFFAPSLVSGSLTATGGSIEGVLGYIGGANGRSWIIENTFAYSNIQGSNTVAATATTSAASASISQRWSDAQDFYIETSFIQDFLAKFNNLGVGSLASFPSFPTLTPIAPSGIAVLPTPRNYWGIGVRAFGVDGTMGMSHGITVGFEPTISTKYLWETVDSKTGKPDGGAVAVKAWIGFPTKGKTLNNVFAGNGAPLTVGAGVNMGTTYGLGITYERGVGSGSFFGL